MNHNQVSVTILVKGRPITEYYHRGQAFVEGRVGSEYEIEVHNHSYARLEAILSVDGLSVTDGKAAGNQSSGYLIDAHGTLRVPGWTLDHQNVAKFAFAGKQGSYATQMTGDTRNNGVIGLMAFRERYRPPSRGVYPWYAAGASVAPPAGAPMPQAFGSLGIAPDITTSAAPRGIAASASNTSYSLDAMAQSAYQSVSLNSSTVVPQVQNSLGTAFGEAQTFITTTVEFQRGDMLAMMVLYYDDLKGLRARGVPIERISKKTYKTQPDAFPAVNTGCAPPPGWRG